MKKHHLTYMICYSLMICCFTPAKAQSKWESTVIKMDKRFTNAIEISSIVYWQDTVYLASPICNSIYIGKINGKDSLDIIATKALGECDYEGASYYQGYFYFSDDRKNDLFRYGPAFGTHPSSYPLVLNRNEGFNGSNNGFEGIAAINDTTFYILLEKGSAGFSILYKGILRDGKIHIRDKKQMTSPMRYCDLFYDKASNTLYLLKTVRRKYILDSLVLDQNNNITKPGNTITSDLVCDFSDHINKYELTYNTNVEGITLADKNTFYIVTDNCDSCSCGTAGGSRKTLFMRFKRTN